MAQDDCGSLDGKISAAALVFRELNPYRDGVMIKESLYLTRHLEESRAFKRQFFIRAYVLVAKPASRGFLFGAIAAAAYGIANSVSPESQAFLDNIVSFGKYGLLVDGVQHLLRYGVYSLIQKD